MSFQDRHTHPFPHSLYSVKWYKGRREFYRYSPRENPPMKTFPIAGVHVVVSALLRIIIDVKLTEGILGRSFKISGEFNSISSDWNALISVAESYLESIKG